MNNIQNPLLQAFNTPYKTAPFSKIKNIHFEPAIVRSIAMAKEEIKAITSQNKTPTFQNTIEALEFTGAKLDRISSIFFNLNSANTSKEIQKIAQRISPLLTEFSNDILLDKALFERVKKVYLQKQNLKLDPEQEMLLEKKYKSFVRNGANLPEEKKVELREIDKTLAQLKLKFGENILEETNIYQLHLTQKEQLEGLPETAVEAAKELADEKGKEGWIISLDYPSYIPFMTYAKNRALRQQLNIAFGSRGFKGDALDNQKNVLEITKLRHKRALLLGYKSHAHFVLEERMAKTPNKVNTFLNSLLEKAKPAAHKEFSQLQELAKAEGINTLQKWDSAYYSEKLKQKLFKLDEEELKPYFKLENVIDGVFTVAHRLYDLNFEETHDLEIYHPDVKTYKVTDKEGNFIAVFYADFHPRAGKRNGAWMTSFKNQWFTENLNSRPHISIVCNFTKPTANKPSLLTFNEVTTLFHEFGHALHGILANTKYPSLSGTNVSWDFVELPSQVLENWCYEKEALSLFATHYKTGAVIPMELIQKIKKSASFQEGLNTLRQLSFGLLDMGWHSNNPEHINTIKDFEDQTFKSTQFYPTLKETCMSTAFSHIFQGGYSSGYYSYKWAEVLDADAFEYFKEKGIFNKAIAQKFKTHVLSKGGTQDPMTLYKQFRGKAPQVNALLRRAGLILK